MFCLVPLLESGRFPGLAQRSLSLQRRRCFHMRCRCRAPPKIHASSRNVQALMVRLLATLSTNGHSPLGEVAERTAEQASITVS